MNPSAQRIIYSQFKPAWWLTNRHAQTLWPAFFHPAPRLEISWETLDLPDGDFIDLVWTQNKPGPIVILLHGLEGGIESHYAKNLLHTIHDAGWTGVLMHFRGCSGRHNRLLRSYHSGETGDLRYFIETLGKRYPDSPLAAIGISLGGNVLLKYLGETRDQSGLAAAMAVSVPFDLANGARTLNRGFARLYQRYLVNRLANKIRDKFSTGSVPVRVEKLPEWDNFYRFDHNVTAPLHGFKSADDYYQRSSSRQFLKDIITPTHILHSRDDPFLSPDGIPKEDELSDACCLELTEKGGHVGFIYGAIPGMARYWIERRLREFLIKQFSGEKILRRSMGCNTI